ncbi:glycosyltransferase [bacterium]|nr:glycosyltransferase [bacterium]
MKFVGSGKHFEKDKELLKNSEIKNKKILYCWFASWKTLLAFLTHPTYKKVVVVGGYEVSDIKGYGLCSSRLTSWIPKLIFRLSDRIFPVCDGLHKEVLKMGVKKEKVKTIYDCVEKIFKNEKRRRKYDYITVMNTNKKNWRIKGLDILIDYAKKNSDKNFLLIGNQFLRQFPKNIKIIRKIPHKRIVRYYNESKKYLCTSRREGFGKAIMEAFMCGCKIIFVNNIYPKRIFQKYSKKQLKKILSPETRKKELIKNLKNL